MTSPTAACVPQALPDRRRLESLKGQIAIENRAAAIFGNIIKVTQKDDGTIVNKTLDDGDVDETFSDNFSPDTWLLTSENPA